MTQRVSKDLSMSEAAFVLGVNPKTIARWCNEGKIAHYRTLGGHRRIPSEEMARLLDTARGFQNGLG